VSICDDWYTNSHFWCLTVFDDWSTVGTVLVNIWNSLSSYVVSAETVNCFKTRLDRFCLNQDVIYNFRSEIHGNGSLSEITVFPRIVAGPRIQAGGPSRLYQ